jgi:hypothetical protein
MSKNVLLMKIGRADHIYVLFASNVAPARALGREVRTYLAGR